VVANLRNEAIARVVPSVRRAYARSFVVPDAGDACQDGENKERRESKNLSFSPRERLVAPAFSSRINGTGNTKQHARARTHYARGRETRTRLPPTIICQNMPLPRFPRGTDEASGSRDATSEYLRWVRPER